MPLVSILMPVRDDLRTLPDCLESIQKQSLKDWELVVVDDGSSDGSGEFLLETAAKDSRIRVFRERPRGIVAALNSGLAACAGAYVARMDADDRMRPERLETQFAFLQRETQVDFCGSRVEPFTEEGPVSENVQRYHDWSNSLLTDEEIRRDLFAESPIMHPTFFGPRKLYEFLGGYLEQPWAEDYDFLLRAAHEKVRFGKCPEVLVEKRHAPDRLSRVDPIYKRPAMMRAKVHYLLKSGMMDPFENVLIAGTGPTGRELARAFLEKEVSLAGFVDNRQGPPERKVLGYPAWGFPDGVPIHFLESFTKSLIVLGIGDQHGQSMMTQLLRQNGWIENQSFVRMA